MSLLLDNYTIELGDEANLALSKSIYDVIEPDKRKSAFTKTITISSSPQNDKVFNGLFEVNYSLDQDGQFDPFFNPSKKAPCFIHTDTMEQMTGYAQLTDVILNHYTNKVEYKITIYGEVRDLFGELADKKLSELDLSKYNHAYTKTNIVSSWDYDVYENGVLQTYSEGGNGYVYPQVDYGDDHQKWNGTTLESSDYWRVEHFRPWIYCKTIVDQIFRESGFSYYSTFFESSLFKKLIYQGDVNGLKLTDDEINAISVSASNNSQVVYTKTFGTAFNTSPTFAYSNRQMLFQSETTDPATQYDPTTSTFTIGGSGKYIFNGSLLIRATNNSGTSWTASDFVECTIAVIKSDGTILASWIDKHRVGTSVSPASNIDYTIRFSIPEVSVTAGDVFRFVMLNFNYVGGSTNSLDVTLKTTSAVAVYPQPEMTTGSTIDISNMLSEDITQKDFLLGLAKMFNLYIEPYWFRVGDSNSGKYAQYLIETRDEYFTEDVVDWTGNLDLEKDFVIKPMALAQYKYYQFTYKEDNDFLNDKYKGSTGRIYGDYVHFIDNDFSKDTKKIEIPFSPAVIGDFYSTTRAIPIIKPSNGGVRVDGKPKILFYQGNFGTGSAWNFEGETQNNCPYAGQLDSNASPTCDLNFKVPAVLYYKGDVNGEITLTSSTLFNKYYYRQVFEMNDKNSKMVECYMRLRPDDIHNLSFRPLYFIKNAYYRLYEVVDHNYSDTTLCRFLKINVVNPINNTVVTTKGGRGVFGTLSDKLPTKASPTEGQSAGGFGTPVGSINGGVVMGGDTSGERVNKGLLGTGILQAGTTQSVITKDDVIDFGFQYMNIASGNTTLDGSEGSPVYIIADTTTGDALLYLPDYTTNFGKAYFTIKTVSGNQLQVYDHTDTLVHTCTSSNESHQFFLTETGVITLG